MGEPREGSQRLDGGVSHSQAGLQLQVLQAGQACQGLRGCCRQVVALLQAQAAQLAQAALERPPVHPPQVHPVAR